MSDLRVVATGLCFPEGPVAMPDGSIVLGEIERQTLSRILPDGTVQVIARTGGGPNGVALGPDGAFYICNNGGFAWRLEENLFRPVMASSDYVTGSIQRVDPKTGAVSVLYDKCGANKINGPNDIVFDAMAASISPTSARREQTTVTTGWSITHWQTARRSSRSRPRC